ncbi:hypothetical protein Tco_0538543 [Tanacetum coccineum]
MVKVSGMKKGGIMAIVEGEAHSGLGLRGGLLGMQAQSHIGKIIISKLTYKLGGLLLLSPIDFRIEPQLGLYVKLGEMLGLRSLTSGIKSSGSQVLWLTRIDQEEVFIVLFFWKEHEGSILFGLPVLVVLGKQVRFSFVLGFKKSDYLEYKESMEYMMKNVFGLRWNYRELNRIVKLRFFRSIQQCMKSEVTKNLGVAWIQQQHGLVNKINVTLFAKQHSAWELFSYREDSSEAAFAVVAVDKIYAHELLTFNNTVACEVISKWKAGLKDAMDARSDDEIWATKGLLDKAKGNVLGMEIIKDQSSNTLRVSQSKIHNEKLVHTLLKGHSTLSLGDSLSGDCDLEKNMAEEKGQGSVNSEVLVVVKGLEFWQNQSSKVFVDFDYAMGRLITVMSRLITWYGLMILGCARSLKANLQHMKALSTTEAGYMTFIEAWKKEIWLKGLLTESRYELRLVAGFATGALVKDGSRFEVPAQVEVAAYRY